MSFLRPGISLFAFIATFPAFAAPSTHEIEKFLKAFHENPKKVMNELPKKSGASSAGIFKGEMLQENAFVGAKDRARRKQFPRASSGGRSGIGADDEARWLVDHGRNLITKLSDLDAADLRSSELDESPWSDDYWALYQGALGKRYNDPAFPSNWKSAFDQVTMDRTYSRLFESIGVSALDVISPAEKYDLLVGNENFEFTRANWADGEGYQRQYGHVEPWMGLCHGWAAAAYMMDRPIRAITVLAADGKTPLKFYPSDIKALATRLWATLPYHSKFAGGRCNDKKPPMDLNGRIISQRCFDTNPGTFHLAMVNQIGVSRRSFVMDATFDYEVWNQPIHSYSLKYFNPETRESKDTAEAAMIPLHAYTTDKFRNYRSPLARFVVGVAMNVGYVVETAASARTMDSPAYDAIRNVTYFYDLEIDTSGNVIGGEWYQNAHPDFLWTPAKDLRLMTDYDPYAQSFWDVGQPLPLDWQEAARSASRQTLPLAKIVERLIFESRLQN